MVDNGADEDYGDGGSYSRRTATKHRLGKTAKKVKSKIGKQLALDTFAANRQIYHPIAVKMVAKDMELQECIPC